MARVIHHIFPNGHGGWCVRRDGEDSPVASTATKIQAIKIGAELSRHDDALVVVHEQERRIRRTDAAPAEIPFPFPFSDRDGERMGDASEEASADSAPRTLAGSSTAETYLTFDFQNGA